MAIAALVIVGVLTDCFGLFSSSENAEPSAAAVEEGVASGDEQTDDGQAVDRTTAEQTASEQGAAEVARPTYQTDCFRFVLPSEVSDKVAFSETNNTVEVGTKEGNAWLFRVFPAGEKTTNEAAFESGSLGEVYIAGHYEEAVVEFAYLDADGKNMHWSSDAQGQLGVQTALGMSPDEFARCVYLSTGSEYVESALSALSDAPRSEATREAGAAAQPDGPSTEPFWGIWVGAGRTESEVASVAADLRAQGYKPVVVLTTDWANLNSEPWYVVSAGSYESRDAADGALDAVKSAGYADAYVKYSGDHV